MEEKDLGVGKQYRAITSHPNGLVPKGSIVTIARLDGDQIPLVTLANGEGRLMPASYLAKIDEDQKRVETAMKPEEKRAFKVGDHVRVGKAIYNDEPDDGTRPDYWDNKSGTVYEIRSRNYAGKPYSEECGITLSHAGSAILHPSCLTLIEKKEDKHKLQAYSIKPHPDTILAFAARPEDVHVVGQYWNNAVGGVVPTHIERSPQLDCIAIEARNSDKLGYIDKTQASGCFAELKQGMRCCYTNPASQYNGYIVHLIVPDDGYWLVTTEINDIELAPTSKHLIPFPEQEEPSMKTLLKRGEYEARANTTTARKKAFENCPQCQAPRWREFCAGCGFPDLRVIKERPPSTELHLAPGDRESLFSCDDYLGKVWSPISNPGTLREQRSLARWGPFRKTPEFCWKCGSSQGCMHPPKKT